MDPVSLSFPDLNVLHAAASNALLVRVTDAGNGAGTWTVSLVSQAATPGATLDFPGTVTVAPGGEADVSVVAKAPAGAAQGENYGFVVLRQGNVTRRIPYFFLVDKPALASREGDQAEAAAERRPRSPGRTSSRSTAIRSRRSATRPTRRR